MDQQVCVNFYRNTKAFLERKARANGVTDLDKYYEVTDTKMPWYRNFRGSEIAHCFAQLAFHAQNATLISNIVKFEENFDFLREKTCDLEPNAFYEKYCANYLTEPDRGVLNLVNVLRYDEEENPNGLSWNSNESEDRDRIAKRYATALIRGATYLKGFRTKEELVTDLLSNHKSITVKGIEYPNRKLIEYFMDTQMGGRGSGFSVALTCDFLKELDAAFNFLGKPDVHIKDVLIRLLGLPKNYYHTQVREFECLRNLQEIVGHINEGLPKGSKPITVYQLDRMIWLICSGKFFLDEVGLSKKDYLDII